MTDTVHNKTGNVYQPERLVAIAGALWLATTATAWAQTRPVPFDVPCVAYDTALYPEGIYSAAARVADFNHDGVSDLASVSSGAAPRLVITFGDGLGGYTPSETYPLTLDSLDLEVGDFDRDGHIDVAVAETGRFWEGTTISIWRNNGSGQFTRTRTLGAGNTGPSGLTAADLNGDGWLDLATAHDRYIEYGNSIAVILSDGVGGFRAPVVYTITSGTNRITAADLDGDTRIDLVVGHETNRWTFMRNTGAGGFASSGTFTGVEQGSLPDLPTVHVVDFDRDGDQDVFYSHRDTGGPSDGAFGFWRNNGGGNFAAPETIRFNWYANGPVNITTADVTGDGWLDVLAATGNTDQWYLVPGNGSGGFAAPRRFRAGENPISMHAADLDRDTDLDVVIVCGSSMGACVYLNPGNGAFVQPPVIDMTDPGLAPAFPTNLQVGDIDTDGDLDLVIGFRADFANTHGIAIRRNTGSGQFAPIETYTASTYPLVVRLRDIDGNRKPDLIFKDSTGAIRARINDGSGAFGSIRMLTGAYVEGDFDLWDVDADGDLDLVYTGFFEVSVALNRGDGTFNPAVSTDPGNFVNTVGMGDFNADGLLDLLTDAGAQGSARVAFGDGTGRFGTPFDVPAGRAVSTFATGDFDRNGVIDFATAFTLDERGLAVRRGRGNGDFHILKTYYGSLHTYDHTGSLIFADVQRDGAMDALTANFGAQDVSIWNGLGNGDFDRLMRVGVGQQPVDLGLGDFDGDGVVDLAVVAQVDSSRWWYPGVSIFRGVSPSSDYGLVLSQTALRRGQVVSLHAQGAAPDEQVHFIYSTRGLGQGACPPQLGGVCLDLRNPVTVMGTARADGSGVASLRLTIPNGAPLGAPAYTQAVARRGRGGHLSVKSRPIESQITP